MELGVGGSYRCVQVSAHCMLVYTICRFSELISQQVHQILHQIALGHQQVLTDVTAMTFKLVLCEEDV